MLLVPFQAFVDLTACSQEFYTQLGKPFGLYILPHTRHLLELFDQFVKPIKALVCPSFWQLVPHVPGGMTSAQGNALFPLPAAKRANN